MMKMKRALLALLMTCILTATLIIGLSAEVRAANSKYFGLYNHSNYRPTNVLITTYCMGTTGSTNTNKPVIRIYEYNGLAKSSTVVDSKAQIYCLRAGLGFGAGEVNPDANSIREYTYSHDLKDKAGMATIYQNTLPSGDYYNEMVWVLDNLIDPRDENTADDEAVLSAAGTSLTAFKTTRNGQMTDEQYANIVEAIQQCIIWYFTNRDTSSEFTQQAVGSSDVLQTLVAGIKYGSAGNTYGSGTPINQLYTSGIVAANTPVGKLAQYYLTKAEENKATALSSTGTNTASFDKSRATMVKSDGYYYVGPYKYTGVDASSVTITTPNSAPHTLVKAPNASGAELSGSSDTAKVNGNKNTDFYIKVPMKYNDKTVSGNVSINVKASYTNKTLTYWNVEGAVNNNQPLAVIGNTPTTLNDTDTKEVSNPVFDLALRKYITEIKDKDGNVKYSSSELSNRVPNIAKPPVFNLGTNNTTATKAHQKDAIEIAEGDQVTYTIIVYNEGTVAGSNITVTDYLPSGLQYVSGGWTAGTAASGYTPYTLNYGTVAAYDGGNDLKSVSKTIVCKVTATAGNDRIDLKNITEITSATGGTDRDSAPGNLTPSNTYNPSTAEQGMGVQDDDDYEHLYLEPKAFDLALRKYITEIKDKDGKTKYSQEQVANRKPEIANPPKFNLDENRTAEKTHEKDALKVEKGDLVTYTIVVYNEGELDGSNIVVKDYLPAGLSYKSGDWTADGTNNGYTTYKSNYGEVSKYDGKGILPSKSKTITCEVTSDVGNETIDLKNIAEITEATGGTDRDSAPGNLTPSNTYNPSTAEQGMGEQDDDDFEHLYIEPNRIVDLALRKHIIKVTNSDGSTIKYSEEQLQNRNPNIATPPAFNLDDGTTAEKKHTKAALTVKTGDLVTYRINVYNEGNVAANNVVVTDYIPAGLKVVSDGWTKGETDSKGYTAYTKTYSSIPAASETKLGELYDDIVCEVVATSGKTNINLKNIAEITTFEGEDRDSEPGTITPSDDYNPEDSEKGKGIQDDDDFENIVLEPSNFDLALKKFIAAVNGKEMKTNGVYDRAPSVDTSKRDGDKVTSFTYTFSANKEPIKVENNDVITYIIRVYNEGGQDGYAKQIKDDIPVGLVFLPDNEINTKNGWYMIDSSGKKTTDVSKAVSVVTDDFGYGKDKAKLLKAFDQATMANNPDYLDVEIAFKVGQPADSNKERIVINSAQVSENSDENGDKIDDIDSDEDNMTPGKPSEDDEDIEKIYVKYFDLSLRKWTTQAIVIEDGKQTTKNTGHKPTDDPEALVKVEVNKKRIESTVIKFKYTIRVTNEGEIAGAATEISEYVPDGLKFVQSDNPDWKESKGKVVTTKLKDKILQPGEYADIDIILQWVNSANNVKAMNNIAEISDDYNESGTPDRDSIPNNKKDGEDDIDDAPVIVTMVTGSKPTYFLLAGSVLAIIVSGATLLKKYVLS